MKLCKYILIGFGFTCAQNRDAIPLTGLELWIRADSVKIQDGKILQLYDLSGKRNHPLHDTQNGMDPFSPVRVGDANNGRPTLRFNDKFTGFSFANIGNIRTVIAVLAKDSTSCLPTLPNYQTPAKFFLGQDDGVTNFHPEHGCSIYNANLSEVSPLLVNGKTYVNGKPVADGRKTFFPFKLGVVSMVPTGNVKANTIARDRTMTNRSWQGDISEILIYSIALDDSTRIGVENFLMAKYGINGVVNLNPKRMESMAQEGRAQASAISFIRPYASGAEILFTTIEAGHVLMAILDLRGRRILTLLDLHLEPGGHSLRWNGNDADGLPMTPGTFIAELASTTGSRSQRLFFLR